MIKTVVLTKAAWAAICALIEVSPCEDDHRYAALIKEQLSGAVKVRATSGGKAIRLTAPKNRDLRNVAEALLRK